MSTSPGLEPLPWISRSEYLSTLPRWRRWLAICNWRPVFEIEQRTRQLEIVQSRNQADAAVHSVKKSLGEHGDKLEAGEKEKIEAALKEVEEALKGEDKAAIDAKTEALMTASQKLGEKVYADMQAQQAAAGAAGAAGASEQAKPADDNVVDAEVKEVKKG